MPYWEPHLKPKIWYSLLQGENWLATPMLTMLPLPFCGFTLVKLQPVRYYKIESPSELYATVVHPQIELNIRCAFRIKKFLSKAQLCNGNVRDTGAPKITT
jgi:hypothetical protein